MTTGRPIPHLLAAAFVCVLCTAGCGRPPPDTVPPPQAEAWTPGRIAADPDGYLQFADAGIRQQVALREQRLADLDARRAAIEQKSAGLLKQVEDAGNIATRLATAIRRAEDEERWPLKFAGRSFSRDKANSVLSATTAYAAERKPLAAAYADALQRIEAAQRTLRNDLAGLAQMREKIALDLERVRLNAGMAELAELRQTEAKLASFSATLAGMTDDPLADPTATVPDLDVNELLK